MRSRCRPWIVCGALAVAPGVAAADVGTNRVGVAAHIPAADVVVLVADLEAHWMRVDNNWLDHGDPCGDDIQFLAPLDDAVIAASDAGVDVYMTLAYTPPCASTGDGDGNPRNDVPVAALYGSYVRQSVAHYRALGVTHFGLWNEANLDHFFAGTAQQYVDTVLVPGFPAVAAGCADAGFDDCKVLGPDLAHVGEYDVYLQDTLTAMQGAGLMFDILAHHIYQGFDVQVWEGDSFVNALDQRRFAFTRRSLVDVLTDVGLASGGVPSIEVWITETGYRAQPPTDAGEMAHQAEHAMKALDEQVQRPWYTNTFFYEIVDSGDDIDGFGITRRNPDGSYFLKDAYLALQDRLLTDPDFDETAQPPDPDAGPSDPGGADAGPGDPGGADAGPGGAGGADAGAGADDPVMDGGGCHAAGGGDTWPGACALLAVLLVVRRSRRRCAGRGSA